MVSERPTPPAGPRSTRLTQGLFHISDACAWMLAIAAAAGAASFPFLAPVLSRMRDVPLSATDVAGKTLVWSIVAFGAWQLTRRRPWALAAVALPVIVGDAAFNAVYLGLTALVFGLPLLLAFNEARRTARPSAPR